MALFAWSQTDGLTHDDSIYRASIVSRGKNAQAMLPNRQDTCTSQILYFWVPIRPYPNHSTDQGQIFPLIPMTLSGLQGRSCYYKPYQMWFCRTVVQQVARFQVTSRVARSLYDSQARVTVTDSKGGSALTCTTLPLRHATTRPRVVAWRSGSVVGLDQRS